MWRKVLGVIAAKQKKSKGWGGGLLKPIVKVGESGLGELLGEIEFSILC